MITRAAAEVALELFPDRMFVEVVALAVNQVDGRHDHARRAESALQTVILAERLLHRVQWRTVGRETLDRGYAATVSHDCKHRAGLYRPAVHMNDAGAALRRVAAN